jgi:hypothetical protein
MSYERDPRAGLFPLSGDTELLLERLDRSRVVVVGDAASGCLALAIANLVARFAPGVEIRFPGDQVDLPVFGAGALQDLGERLVRSVGLGVAEDAERTVVVRAGTGAGRADVYVSADGWSLRMTRAPHVALIGTGPAVAAASALAAAEVLRQLLPELPGLRLRDSFEWNLVDYRTGPATEAPPPADVEAVCFGAGSVGSSLVYALLLSGAAGRLQVVDDDRLMAHNRLRYPLWIDAGPREKVRWLEQMTAHSSLRVSGLFCRADEWVRGSAAPPRLAISAVDTADGRRQVADALARTTLNAGIEGLRLHVSRHRFGDGLACVYCPYVDTGDPEGELDILRDLTRLTIPRLRELLGGDRLTVADVNAMIDSGTLSDRDRDLVGGRIADVARARLYAQASVPTPEGAGAAVTAPFVPALAGAILAAEAMKEAAGGRSSLERRVDVDCSGFPTGWTSKPAADSTGRCLCHSPLRLAAYRRAWATT